MFVALGADGCTVSTLEPEHNLRSEGDVAVAVALDGREYACTALSDIVNKRLNQPTSTSKELA
jgi:hypothetical protein